MKMKKMKLLTAILFCLGIAGMASAMEVIQIDLNGYGNNTAYNGYALGTGIGTNIWGAYYGGSAPEGWGNAMGSPRTADLADYDEPCMPSTYAAQVWIGDNDANVPHDWIMGSGTGLTDDGFKKNGGGTDPNIFLWGVDAYAGIYDIYLLGEKNTTHFKVTSPAHDYGTQTADGDGVAEFDDVIIGADVNVVTVCYDSNFYGIQLVRKLEAGVTKEPLVITNTGPQYIEAVEYDVAFETNTRSGEPSYFGPDIEVNVPLNSTLVAYLDAGEYMGYDIKVATEDAGYYEFDAQVLAYYGPVDSLQIYVDDVLLGTLQDTQTSNPNLFWVGGGGAQPDEYVYGNLFKGNHTIKWRVPAAQYFNIRRLRLLWTRAIAMDCNDVYFYQFGYANDFNRDCHVDFEDLKLLTDDWLNCYSPDPNDCL